MSQTEEKEDFITHIRHSSCDPRLRNVSWCGVNIQYQFAFGNVDHAAYTASANGRLVPCQKCIDSVMKALQWQATGLVGMPLPAPSDVTRPTWQKQPLMGDKVLVPGYTRVFIDD